MTVINLTITESSEQVVSGIPKTVTISSNIPTSIFYTLDGTTPTLFSSIYVDPIVLPINQLSVILNVYATNGTDVSPVISETYTTDIIDGGARLPHSATTAPDGTNLPNPYPYGSNSIVPNAQFLNPGDAGFNVNDPNLPTIPSGFDADGNPNANTNLPYNSQNYEIVYSTQTPNGQPPGIGNLPAEVKIEVEAAPENNSEQFTNNMFDPRAMVIFQDFSKEDPEGPVSINKQYFTLQNPEKSDGNLYYTTGLDSPTTNGSFLRSHYNPRDNTITYYYLDTWANRWIISKAPYVPTGSFNGNLSNMVAGGGAGGRFVFEWIPNQRRYVF